MIVGCDIDGVIVDPGEFFHLIPDWKEYYRHTVAMKPIPEMITLVKALIQAGHRVTLITSRPSSDRDKTVEWLEMYFRNCPPFDLLMRPEGDARTGAEIKMSVLRELRPDMMIEDEPKTVKMMMAEGFTVLQVHGYRLSDEDSVPQG